MFRKLLQFEVFYQFKQRAFPLFAILFLVLGVFVGRQGFAPQGINFNAVYQVYFHSSLFTLGSVFIIMFFAVSAMLRDRQYQMEGLIFSSSIKKSDYFCSRFLGTFIFSVLAFTPFLLGYILGIHFSNLDPERIGDFEFLTYLQPWLYIVLPNILICSSIVFSVSTLTKNSTATYVSAVFVYMLYFVSSIFLNSPLLAQSVPASPESMAIAAIADPFGIAAFFEQTQYWTPYQKNTQLLSFSGLFLWNRLIWILVSVGVLSTTYRVFSFRKISKKSKKEKKVKTDETPLIPYRELVTVHGMKAQLTAFFFLLKLELKSVFKSLPFIAVLIMWLFIVFAELYATAVKGGEYGVSVYPFTSQLIALIDDALTLFSLILIVFYSAEIVWKERNLNFNLIVDATPVKNWVFFSSKFAALLLLPIILISTGIAMCLAFQSALGHSNYEFSLYASVYYHYGLQLAIFSMIALFINSLVKNKYMGMGIFGLIVIVTMKSDMLRLEHPLTSLGFLPRVSYTNMNGFYDGPKLFDHLALYWFALGLILTLLSFKIWNRGVVAAFSVKLKQLRFNWTWMQKLIVFLLILLFIGSGSLIFYNMNIASDYLTLNDQLDLREQYEKKFKKYQSLERPYASSRKTEVAIFPKERAYEVKSEYVLENTSDQPLNEVFITERIPLKYVSISSADLIEHDQAHGTYLFRFKNPLAANDSVLFHYELRRTLEGYQEDNSIVSNGTYITHRNFEPTMGYHSGMEILNRVEREKRNLPQREEENKSDSHIELDDFKNKKIKFETIVSTDKDQIALSSGNLVKDWSEGERNFYHYKSEGRIIPMVGYFSAKYKSKKVNYKGISIEQYFDENHDFNIEEVENSTKQTLDYCQDNFGSYNFNHVRIAEIPSHWSFGGFAHPGVISMVEDRLHLANVSDPNTFNLVAKRTIHEVAHQWWAHTLSAKPVPGGSLFVEGFAKYTEGVIMEKMYGKRALYELSDDARRKYFSGRSLASDAEPPVYKVFGQGYISYGKAYTVLMALRDLIGEDQVNDVLKSLTDKYRGSSKLEANSIELLEEIYKVTPNEYHNLIEDWFKKVITYDLKIDDVKVSKTSDNRYKVVIDLNTKRFETNKDGSIKEIEIDEPIQIGMFSKHPKLYGVNDKPIHAGQYKFSKEESQITITVDEKPVFIAIDPYGTRSDENLQDNIFQL